MMGNVWEWMEGPHEESFSSRQLRGGGSCSFDTDLASSYNRDTYYHNPETEEWLVGFRVASVPEPATMSLLGLGGVLALLKRKRHKA